MRILPFFKNHTYQRGNFSTWLILGAAVLASYVLTGGLIPQVKTLPDPEHYLVPQEETSSGPRQNLQLQTLVFATPTPSIPACDEGVVMGILVDISGSMNGNDNPDNPRILKLDNLKTALHQFIDILPRDTIIANLQPFAFDSFEFVPFDYLRNNSDLMHEAASALETAGEDRVVVWQGQTLEIGSSTYQKNAVEKITPKLLNAKNSFPNGQAYLVFMTDGVPETNDCRIVREDGQYHIRDDVNSPLCGVTIDTHPQNPVAASQFLKDQGVKIFTIALYGEREDEHPAVKQAIRKVMRDVASDPDSTYYLETPTSSRLEDIYTEIAGRLCK